MAQSTQTTWNDWLGADVADSNGDKIGSLKEVFMDRATGKPEWLLVKTGIFGGSRFVPIEGVGADGEDLRVPFSTDQVKDAPDVSDDDGFLPSEEEAKLYQHYGRGDYQQWDDNEKDVTPSERSGGNDGHDTSGPNTDSAMTRSEEELEVGTRNKEVGKVRLRKYVVTENVTTTVPVRKERVEVVREPITEENRDAANRGANISEEEHEVILHEEEAVVGKKTVAKERVRLDTDTVVEDHEVSDEIRKEKIEVDDSTDATKRKDR
jgi:uncharacterized protein (TIGR02271 family)